MPALPIQLLTTQERSAGDYRGAQSSAVDLQRATGSFQQVLGMAARDEEVAKQQEVQRIRQLEQDEARTHVINAESRIQARVADRITQAREAGALVGLTESLSKDFETWTKEEVDGAPTAAKSTLNQVMARLRGDANLKVAGLEVQDRQKRVVTDFSNGLEDDRRLVYADPAQFPEALARRRALAASLQISDVDRQELDAKARQELAAGAATSMAENTPQQFLDRAGGGDPEKAAAAVKNDPILSNLSPESLRATMHLARTELNRRSAEDRYDVVSRTKDVQTMTMAGVPIPAGSAPTVEQYTRTFGPSGAARWQDEVGNYLQISGAVQQMRTSTPEERNALIAAAAPTPGAGFAGGLQMRDALLQAKQVVEKQIVSDPAQYALTNSPRVQQAYTVMQRVLNDPKQGAEDRAAVVDFFARTSEAEQLRLGIGTIRDEQAGNRPRGPKPLTNAEANAISDQFNDQTTGGANAAKLVQGLETYWGKWWPKVYGQLAADNKLPPAALVIPNMPNDASRSRMAAVSALKPSELKDLVAGSDVKDIRDATLAEFDQAQRTFTAQGVAGNRTLGMVIDSAEKLATLYRSQGQSVKAAARQAYTETMGWKYQFADTYRVPNEFDAKQVGRGTSAAVDQLLKEGGYTAITGGVPEILNQDALRSRSMWINTPDEGGLQLMLRGADGGVYAVHGKDGGPVRMNFSDLTTKAAQARAADNTQEGHQDWMRRRQQELNPRR